MGNTPSPLRNAMDDVMSSLDGMGVSDARRPVSPSPQMLDQWAPEAFDQTYSGSQRGIVQPRPATSMDAYGAAAGSYEDEPPVLSNYVARMESRLRKRYPRGSEESLVQPQGRGHGHSHSMGGPIQGNGHPVRGQEHGSGSNSMAHPITPAVPDKLAQQPGRPHTSMADRRFQDTGGMARPKSALGSASNRLRTLRHKKSTTDVMGEDGRPLRRKKSAFEVGKEYIGRTFTTKSTSTNASSGTQATTMTGYSSVTDKSVMSGYSAGGISATSAGSLNRKRELKELLLSRNRAKSELGNRENDFASIKNRFEEAGSGDSRPTTPMTGLSYHSSHATEAHTRPRAQSVLSPVQSAPLPPSNNGLGGFMTPKPKKSGFFKRVFESGKAAAANTRKTLSTDIGRPKSSKGNRGFGVPDGVNSIAGGRDIFSSSGPPDGADEGADWVQVRRDVNRANSLSAIEIQERQDRARLHDFLSIYPLDELQEQTDGDEDAYGEPVENPVNFQSSNLALVDKTVRFIKDVPTTDPELLATHYLCRPYKSDVQKLRAIFTWVAERIIWESEINLGDEPADIVKVLASRRGCPEEVSVLFMTMARAVGLTCQVVRGYLKTPGEPLPTKTALMPQGNHWWCTALVDGHWRMLDVCLASPSHPLRSLFSSTGPTMADSWYFLVRPSEFAYTHIPEHSQHQHLAPAVKPELLLALPGACPPYFKNGLKLVDYNTALLRLENLEVAMVRIIANEDTEIIAEVETREFVHDADGDFYESGEIIRHRTLAQAEWVGGIKRYTVKAVLPEESSQGVLKIYAGGRGLWHSSGSIPHPVALALPLWHSGKNPAFDWVKRHPTPHANRHDIYVVQPQCFHLVINNTYVFAVRQHPATAPTALGGGSIDSGRPGSAMSNHRPGSSMSNAASVSSYSASTGPPSSYSSRKPAKLAIQSPNGKILRLMRKEDKPMPGHEGMLSVSDGGTWETIIKCGERGTWRGLVLADRSARWCVFCEWECI